MTCPLGTPLDILCASLSQLCALGTWAQLMWIHVWVCYWFLSLSMLLVVWKWKCARSAWIIYLHRDTCHSKTWEVCSWQLACGYLSWGTSYLGNQSPAQIHAITHVDVTWPLPRVTRSQAVQSEESVSVCKTDLTNQWQYQQLNLYHSTGLHFCVFILDFAMRQ